jgi:hypothetical protein
MFFALAPFCPPAIIKMWIIINKCPNIESAVHFEGIIPKLLHGNVEELSCILFSVHVAPDFQVVLLFDVTVEFEIELSLVLRGHFKNKFKYY